MNKKTVILIAVGGCVIVFLCAIASGIGYFLYKRNQDINESVQEDTNASTVTLDSEENSTEDIEEVADEEQDAATEEEPVEEDAVITGSVSYPSEYIPPDMTVCAENSFTMVEYCADGLIEDDSFMYGYGYEITVPAGSYYVYANVADLDPDYKAYYDEYVTCGMSVDCDSHDPIMITVLPGQTAEDVDPMDWYR